MNDELRAKFEATFPHLDFSADSYGNYYSQRTLDHLYGYRAAHASRDAEVEALRKDAERYRWLRKNHNADLLAQDVIDEAIDYAKLLDDNWGKENKL